MSTKNRSTEDTADTCELWTIVLAAGDGKRLRSLTRALHGDDVPKQFAVIQKDQSLLQSTMERVKHWSALTRTVVVVGEDQEDLARPQLAALDGVELVLQPRNAGTGPGLLLPLWYVLERNPRACVLVTPSDHYVDDVDILTSAVSAASHLAGLDDSVVLVGARADEPETQYGWIVKAPFSDRVSGFVEKPERSEAERLFQDGALWHTFIMAGSARRFWELARAHLPAQSSLFDSLAHTSRSRGVARLAEIYEKMPHADFGRDVLQRDRSLRVVELAPCGWSDWGTPERVMRSLRGSPDHSMLIERLKAGEPGGNRDENVDPDENHFAA